MNTRSGRLAPLVAALAAGLLLAVFAPPLFGAEPELWLRDRSAALAAEEQEALLQLYAAESSRANARAQLTEIQRRSRELAREEATARRLAAVAHRSLSASQQRVSTALRALYVTGEVDPIAVVLGATSLDEAIAGIEALRQVTLQNTRLAAEARTRGMQVRVLRAGLADRRADLDVAEGLAQAAAERLGRAVSDRAATLASIRAQAGVTEQRLRELERRADAARVASAGINEATSAPPQGASSAEAGVPSAPNAEPAASASAGEPPPRGGTRTLVVDAVAYYLPGNTASGLPVGVGVIAVDPAVIPLGTRVHVPGYGSAVAADTGSAIQGNIIDLWMPSAAEALAWGRRTVTITVYG